MKLRKFISGLAAGMLLVGALAVNVFAAGNGSPQPGVKISDEAKAAQEAAAGVSGEYILKDGVEVSLPAYVAPVDDITAEEAVKAGHSMFGAKARTLVVFDLTVDAAEKAAQMGIRIHFSEIHKGSKIHFIHFINNAWKEESVVAGRRDEGVDVVLFNDLSPVAIVVEGTESVKTGETLPVMPVIALISIIGAAFCVSKFKFAK